jgi:hypothetical protein
VANSHNPLILENGAKWDRVGITAKDAQLLELLQYSTSDIARIFGVPPHMIGDVDKSTSWGTGIEQQGIGFVRYTLLPHLRRQAAELSRKLFPVQGAKVSPLYIDFDPEAMLVGDAKTQGEFYRVALGGNQLPGFMSVNEVRACRGLQPVPGGDKVYIPTAADRCGSRHGSSHGSRPIPPPPSTRNRPMPRPLFNLARDNRDRPRRRHRHQGRSLRRWRYHRSVRLWRDRRLLGRRQRAGFLHRARRDHHAQGAPAHQFARRRCVRGARDDGGHHRPSGQFQPASMACAPAPTAITLACDSVEIVDGGFYMIHNAWTCAMGNAADLRATADVLDKVDAVIVAGYMARTKLPEAEVRALMAAETWFTAQEAVERGFCDSVMAIPVGGKRAGPRARRLQPLGLCQRARRAGCPARRHARS